MVAVKFLIKRVWRGKRNWGSLGEEPLMLGVSERDIIGVLRGL
jgi:hypothetical protein